MRLFADGNELREEFLKALDWCDSVSFAVAWASSRNVIFKALLTHKAKIQEGIIGLNYYQTDPDVLDTFLEDEAVRFIMQEGGVFHPKIYLFTKGTL